MPKLITTEEELAALKAGLAKVNPGEIMPMRQYVTRIPLPTAIKYIEDALDHHQQPAVRLRELVEKFYSGEMIHLNPTVALLLKRIAAILGKSPNETVQILLVEFGMNKLESLMTKNRQMA